MASKLWRRPAKPPLRYFIYVSDAKLEMLFQQIDSKLLQRLSAEAKVDVKLASLTIKQAEQPAPTRMAKLKVVERYIDLHHRVGTVQEPGSEYFRGTMPLAWGWLEDPYATRDSPNGGFNVAFFRGERDGHTVVLAGSRHHVLGEQPSAKVDFGFRTMSAEPTIVFAIAKHVGSLHETAARVDQVELPEGFVRADPLEQAIRSVEVISGPPRWMEFLAVPLLEGDLTYPETHTVLATPIYVAHADSE